ncbi:hypothetical protein HFC70_25340 [Agrobacterium sp. a22-2]|uniref:plant virulence effector HPE1-like domain-containing protein n=1 Tax=Agrobacterium sp. a22-2 TaxID=2283840 RepID=UPI001445C681|nr:plant virulence effector HPE1-like domain-containing protein [Agrobacterium sp. a22-2]NKN39678.1 hypothetical protein [Agrobacterium sp. a22-2]
MRHLILTAFAVLSSGPVLASSIEVVTPASGSSHSIITMRCTDCPPPSADTRKPNYIVPSLATGTQTVEIEDVGGVATMRRTEAWMGGSPVVFVSKADGWLAEGGMLATKGMTGDGIDPAATTSAVNARPMQAGMGTPPMDAPPAALDTSGFTLRLP